MPLSEEELRLLEQMERALVEEDPKLASTMRGTSMRAAARRRALVAAVAFVVGVVILMTGAVTQLVVVGIIGFVVMLFSAVRRPQLVARPGQGTREAPGRARAPPDLQRHRRRPQVQAPRWTRAAQQAAVERLDDGPLRGALAPPARPERLLTDPVDRRSHRPVDPRVPDQRAPPTVAAMGPRLASSDPGSQAARVRRCRPAPARSGVDAQLEVGGDLVVGWSRPRAGSGRSGRARPAAPAGAARGSPRGTHRDRGRRRGTSASSGSPGARRTPPAS